MNLLAQIQTVDGVSTELKYGGTEYELITYSWVSCDVICLSGDQL